MDSNQDVVESYFQTLDMEHRIDNSRCINSRKLNDADKRLIEDIQALLSIEYGHSQTVRSLENAVAIISAALIK